MYFFLSLLLLGSFVSQCLYFALFLKQSFIDYRIFCHYILLVLSLMFPCLPNSIVSDEKSGLFLYIVWLLGLLFDWLVFASLRIMYLFLSGCFLARNISIAFEIWYTRNDFLYMYLEWSLQLLLNLYYIFCKLRKFLVLIL